MDSGGQLNCGKCDEEVSGSFTNVSFSRGMW